MISEPMSPGRFMPQRDANPRRARQGGGILAGCETFTAGILALLEALTIQILTVSAYQLRYNRLVVQ
jgi:hypothetical protein